MLISKIYLPLFYQIKQRYMLQQEILNVETLAHKWTAQVLLNNGKTTTLWWTAWPSSKNTVVKVLSVASDYPKREIDPQFWNI